jgi:hypothetical protein
MDLCHRLFEMEAVPNQRNAMAILTDDLLLDILRHVPLRSLFSCKCVYRSWNRLIFDNYQVLPQTVVGFFYDSENDNRNFTSIVPGVRPPSLEFLPFNIDNVAVSDCCNGLILCWCLGADGYPLCRLQSNNPEVSNSAA